VVRFSFPEANSSPRSALRSAVPTVYEGRDFVMAGGLLSYGGSLAERQQDRSMRDLIRKRLTEYREEAHERIGKAVNLTKSRFSGAGRLGSGAYSLAIKDDNKTGFAQYMDRSAEFIRHVVPGSSVEYADELRDGGNKLKQEIIAKMERENSMQRALPGNSERVQLSNELEPALDKIIERKIEDFELEYNEGKDMNATIHNEVNIINSEISNAVVQITQSGRDATSKDTAQKLGQLVNSDQFKELPEQIRLEVLDQVTDLIKELKGPTNTGKVHRGLKRVAGFLQSVAANTMADTVAQMAVAYATAYGLIT
jgi:hypothetical protein